MGMGRKTTHHHILRKVGSKIARARTEAGLSQEELAAKISVSRNYMGMVERGERNPTIVMLYKISKALKVPTGKLLTF